MEKVTKYVLDHGVVTLIDVFGSDERILEAARVSYRKGTKQTSTDEQLLRYLLRKHHASPFEMCEVIFYLKLPIFVARQLVRHRTASLNEVSGRYSELPNELYLPTTREVGPQSTNTKQGRGEVQYGLGVTRQQCDDQTFTLATIGRIECRVSRTT